MTQPAAIHYYDLDDWKQRITEKLEGEKKTAGATAWLKGESRPEYEARVAAEGKAPEPHRLYMHPQTVAQKTAREMEVFGAKTHAELAAALPRNVRLNPVKPNGHVVEGLPHLGYTVVGTLDRKNADGTTTRVAVCASNFRANPTLKDGKQAFEKIPPQPDGVKNAPMFYAYALDKDGKLDTRFGSAEMPGVLFRQGEVRGVAAACVQIVSPAPTAQRQQTVQQSMAPRPSMQSRGLAYA
ncbi:hypothetical protein [Agrobacterium radiobacter]|uniref:hypothetical protein n=1 Tax=Agrobacterium radiobacter TaxID=362 RepID=UPI003CE51381